MAKKAEAKTEAVVKKARKPVKTELKALAKAVAGIRPHDEEEESYHDWAIRNFGERKE